MPSKVGFFAWETSWGKVLTLDNLKRRDRALANKCFLCGGGEETVDHLLIHCSRPESVGVAFSHFGGSIGCSLCVKESLLSWKVLLWVSIAIRLEWQPPQCIFWTIW